MYTCGPTVYNPAHLGNFRTFLFEDLLRRALRLRGWDVMQVMNLTDVDDKIIARATERGLTITQVTAPPTEAFHRDREFLRIESAEDYPKATDHIPEMIAMVQALEAKGLAYKAEDGSVYFAIAQVPGRTGGCRGSTRARSAPVRASRRTTTTRRTCAISRSGRPRSPRMRRRAPRGILPGGAAVPAGISSAPRWPSATWARRSTCMRAAWT